MSFCVICKGSKGKIACECKCSNKKIHKKCIPSLAEHLYKRKRDSCETCNVKMNCVKRQHYFKVIREIIKTRLVYTSISLCKSGLVPIHRRHDFSLPLNENEQKEIQKRWEDLIDKELADCPAFAKNTLQNARKNQVVFTVDYGCKWN